MAHAYFLLLTCQVIVYFYFWNGNYFTLVHRVLDFVLIFQENIRSHPHILFKLKLSF